MSALNGVMMQYFHWYLPADGSLWNELKANAKALADSGVTSVWPPPAYKGTRGGEDVGYAVYDIFDLGEFDQRGRFAPSTERRTSSLLRSSLRWTRVFAYTRMS